MKQVHIVSKKGKRKVLKRVKPSQIQENFIEGIDGRIVETQHELISLLLPPAVKAFYAELDVEVRKLCGERYSRGAAASRWGSQPGSIVLGNQHVAIEKARVRDEGGEVALETYERFQDPRLFDEQVFHQGLKRVSQRDYEKGLPKIAASFGVSKSAISRSWVRTTKKQVEKLLNRSLVDLGIVAVFIDGKRFSKLGVVVALGVGSDGKKHVLGIYESSTENSSACRELLDDLHRRGLPEAGVVFVVDGGSGLNKALEEKYEVHIPEKRRALRVRCYVHKWRNIEEVLPQEHRSEAASLFWAIRDAADLSRAQACSDALEGFLKRVNASALRSYLEAKDDLLMLHRLRLSEHLRKFFSTTNPIESLNSLLEEDMRRVKRWRNSEHFQRWLASACLHNEKRMRKIRGYTALSALRVRLDELCAGVKAVDRKVSAA